MILIGLLIFSFLSPMCVFVSGMVENIGLENEKVHSCTLFRLFLIGLR